MEPSKQTYHNHKTERIYYQGLCNFMTKQENAIPRMLIDKDRLIENTRILKSMNKNQQAIRLVVKSLPSLPLLKILMQQLNTKRLMVFHQPFLTYLSGQLKAGEDILLGKPMPVKAATYYFNTLKTTSHFNPYTQIQWLVNDLSRLQEYLQLAKSLKQKIRINLEINVGLHRGGFTSENLGAALELIEKHLDYFEFTGFMGYDPHISKLPSWLISEQKAFKKSLAQYNSCIHLLKTEYPSLYHDQLCFNGAGSPSFHLHQSSPVAINEISIGSALLKPVDFDIPSLKHFKPAIFIATPVLKKRKGRMVPGLERFKRLLHLFSKKQTHSYFIYGGNWKAKYVYPTGIKENSFFGSSSNQSMLELAHGALEVNDYVLLRPDQSEAVLLQFGALLILSKKDSTTWPIFPSQF